MFRSRLRERAGASPRTMPTEHRGLGLGSRHQVRIEFQGFLRVADSLQNRPNRKSRKCLASLVFGRAKGIWPGCSHQAMPPASPRDEPACGGTGRSLAVVFWVYPKVDAEAKFSFSNRTPKQCAGLQEGFRVDLPAFLESSRDWRTVLWTVS